MVFRGISPAIHGFRTYAGTWFSGKEREERKIREIAGRGDRVPVRPVR
ncbi:MAG: 2TM domain-containing protein [Methanomicrobiales archaeon]|nr:2TM domain-containing protein [Methanomicrobiales archaeon]